MIHIAVLMLAIAGLAHTAYMRSLERRIERLEKELMKLKIDNTDIALHAGRVISSADQVIKVADEAIATNRELNETLRNTLKEAMEVTEQ